MLLQVLKDLLLGPTDADVVANDGMEKIAAIGAGRRAGTHDLLELIDAIGTAIAAAKAVAIYACRGRSSLAPFTPNDAPIDDSIDIAEFTNGAIKRIAG